MQCLNKTIEYGLYLLVFLLPIQTRWIIKAGETEYSTYSLYGTDILLIVLLILFLIFNFQTKSKIQNPKYKIQFWRFILGLVLASAVSVFFAIDKLLALYKFGWLILGVGLFWLIISANYSKLKLIYALLTGVFLQAVLGIWQFLTQSSFANKWLGMALHNPANLGVSVIETIGPDSVSERWLRAYAGLDHPNMLGGVMVVGILLVIFLMIKSQKHALSESAGPIKSIKSKVLLLAAYYLLLATFSTALFFSFSRTAWLGLIVGLVVMIVLAIINKNLFWLKQVGKIILIMGILFFVLFSQYQNLITSRLGGDGRLENKSTSERLVSYQESWQMIKNNWATGVGLGNYTYALKRQVPSQESFYYQPAHNVFLLIWSEVGIVGLLFFTGLLFVIAIARSNFTYNNMLAILIALIVIMSLDHWVLSLHFGILFFWLILGLTSHQIIYKNFYPKEHSATVPCIK
ncbi:O-antigen ligase family protein [Patescibacteria group bacterium]|nr:O-antigen ligase family protein [Patescibacteria group bacterium]MBU1663491.1 O-antigen ligase family protein [Patescibacteria group bacterium]MBU1933977.1 O-antigen ligase family protein [Patescibacteria group bacterium]MBU2007985.1 O-antigen ligase family protein [Patescibacteria group bacterium]MBU2233631.1 O-antigen ligase family protein [Patescibacteria group bacterium]